MLEINDVVLYCNGVASLMAFGLEDMCALVGVDRSSCKANRQ